MPQMPSVIVESRPAEVVTKTVPTSTRSTSDSTRMNMRAVTPNSLPTISGSEAPS